MTQQLRVLSAVTGGTGQAFAALFRLLKVARPDRPIHPQGLGLAGELARTGNPAGASGIDWLDSPGTDKVVARFSRSVGLPQAVPDILGLALRVSPSGDAAGPADVLFASTGWGLPGRFVLMPRLDVAGATMTTLMPYRGRRGPVLLGLRTRNLPAGSLAAGEWVLGLHWATPGGPWRECGELRLHAGIHPGDTPLRFDPLEKQPPGAQAYGWTRRLRKPSYRAARRAAPPAVGRPHQEASATNSAVQLQESTTATGRNPMSTVSQLFNAPSADVWRVIADGWLYSGWVVGASRIRDVDAEWPRVGANLHHSVGAWPLVIDDSSRVTAVDPGRSLELVARGWPMGEAKVEITLEDRGSQCLVTIAEDAIHGPGKLMPKALRHPIISARNRETLRRLELMAIGGAGK
ncbi:SRPBCC family protein [Pseudarthrobacter sp. fls2-241-R2A-127]|uniref:SRPBCC family protein n=1 Tax=Pseudarthrobacter sp. fls2-241-R2A-127 TaxID=3040303 RepID=UPI0025522B59|nr:SRPBCC family protein [Pseudarthrobacter sp. fls2-241-R2A-127]